MSTQITAQSTFDWRAHPARERPVQALAAGGVILALMVACTFLGQSIAWGLLAGLVLLVALNRFYLPSRFELDDIGITAKYPLRTVRLEWERLRRFVVDEDGGYLSATVTPSRFDAFRGIHLIFGPHREDAVARIRSHFDQARSDDG